MECTHGKTPPILKNLGHDSVEEAIGGVGSTNWGRVQKIHQPGGYLLSAQFEFEPPERAWEARVNRRPPTKSLDSVGPPLKKVSGSQN